MSGRRGHGAAAALLLAAAALAGAPGTARALLDTAGFRAVGVAHSAHPVSALAVAPDGRLFAAVQAHGRSVDPTPGTAEIRVYSAYATSDGAVLDAGMLWATVEGVRATRVEEGLLGLALAPDFATSGLVYVYLTTTDEEQNQHVRVYRETEVGTGEYLGTVATGLEPAAESPVRNGGPLAFGADGCLYAGIGDNGSGGRWHAQLLRGTDRVGSTEAAALCTDVCLGPAEFPERTVAHDDVPNHAGKVLRLDVVGASPAEPGPGAPFPAGPSVFAGGLRDPGGLAVHPLTGQVWLAENGDAQQAEIDVVDGGSNLGWPCLEGARVATSSVAPCLAGRTADEVYAGHPAWRRPVTTHAESNLVVTGLAAYTGLAYPAAFYGDVFYLLRNSARIHRIDLEPPCFLPHPGGMTPVAFHDSTNDGDFRVTYDVDGDGDFETVSLTNLMAIVQGPGPLGTEVLYVAGRQGNSSELQDDTIVFRIEFATAFTPWDGPRGRVPEACFVDGPYSGGTGPAPHRWENPFRRPRCAPATGSCAGRPDGAPCAGGDPCDGDTCRAGVCEPGSVPAPLEVAMLALTRDGDGNATGGLVLRGRFRPTWEIAPHATDLVRLELRDGAGVVLEATLDHPESDPFWRAPRRGHWRYRDRTGRGAGLTALTLRARRSGGVSLSARGRGMAFERLGTAPSPRLVIGDQCFAADLAGRCTARGRRLRCGRSAPTALSSARGP